MQCLFLCAAVATNVSAFRLVGVGTVERTNSWLMNKVLRLPTDVLGVMKSKFLICHTKDTS